MVMELRSSPILALISIIIVLATPHHADCRYNVRPSATTEANNQYVSAISGAEELSVIISSNKVGPIQSVSRQVVPGGPNPLHNR